MSEPGVISSQPSFWSHSSLDLSAEPQTLWTAHLTLLIQSSQGCRVNTMVSARNTQGIKKCKPHLSHLPTSATHYNLYPSLHFFQLISEKFKSHLPSSGEHSSAKLLNSISVEGVTITSKGRGSLERTGSC